MVKTLLKGLNILEQFATSRSNLNFQELVSRTRMPKATISRFLCTLTSQGYLSFDPRSKKYLIGPRVVTMGFSALSRMDLRNTALPYLEELAEQCDQCINLGILYNSDVVLIFSEHMKRWHILGINVHIGSRLNSYQTAIGRAILAFLNEKEFQFLLNNLLKDRRAVKRIGPKGKVLIKALEEVREKKYALNDEEIIKGLRAIAAPVFNGQGDVEGAVNIPVFSDTMSREELIKRYLPLLLSTTNKISSARGFIGNEFDIAERLGKRRQLKSSVKEKGIGVFRAERFKRGGSLALD